jgi:hypothetical protein
MVGYHILDGEEPDMQARDLPFLGGCLILKERSLYSLAKKNAELKLSIQDEIVSELVHSLCRMTGNNALKVRGFARGTGLP